MTGTAAIVKLDFQVKLQNLLSNIARLSPARNKKTVTAINSGGYRPIRYILCVPVN